MKICHSIDEPTHAQEGIMVLSMRMRPPFHKFYTVKNILRTRQEEIVFWKLCGGHVKWIPIKR